jgi:hypothetical protein
LLKMILRVVVLTLLSSTIVFGQDADNGGCPLASGQNGQTLTVGGKISTGAHDMLLAVPNCKQSVVLVYAGDSETNVPAARLQRDQNLERFKGYTEATYKSTSKNICLHCSKYEVEATLTGQLDVSNTPEGLKRDNLGFLHDSSGKIVGTDGFGHPDRPYKYRLVIESVSNVTARELPKPGARPTTTAR